MKVSLFYFLRKTHCWDCTRYLPALPPSLISLSFSTLFGDQELCDHHRLTQLHKGTFCLSHIVPSQLMIMMMMIITTTIITVTLWFLLKSGSARVWHFVLLTGDFTHHSLTQQLSSRGSSCNTLYPVLMLTSWWILYVTHFAISSPCPGYLWACWKVQTVGELHFSPSLSNSPPLSLICTLSPIFQWVIYLWEHLPFYPFQASFP